MFKIQDTLATKKSLKLLIEQNKTQKKANDPDAQYDIPADNRRSLIEEASDESDDEGKPNKLRTNNR